MRLPRISEQPASLRRISRQRIGEVVRTYHEPDDRVRDHASGLLLSFREVVAGDGLAAMIHSRYLSPTV